MTKRKPDFSIAGLPAIGLVVALTAAGVATLAQARSGDGPVSFETLDINGDGELTQEELQARGAARFATIDTDSDGFLTQAEIGAAETERASKRAARMIKHLDADGDGKLSAEELAKRGRGGKLIERFDADNNGSLSEEEFAEAKAKMRKRHGGKKPASE